MKVFFIKIKFHCKLNTFSQIEWQEEIKLPSKVDVYLKPANTDAWGRVQSLAQNPRVKTILPLQKRVLSLLKTLQHRWRSRDARLVCFYIIYLYTF